MNELQVAVGVVCDEAGRILLARRHQDAHQGGLWEFPGGKVESGESILDALRRELVEELGIEIGMAQPLIRIRHRYPDRAVVLHVYRSRDYSGRAAGLEGQEIRWVEQLDLHRFEFPKANLPIISAIRLPAIWPIWNFNAHEAGTLTQRFERWQTHQIELIQLRCTSLSAREFANWVEPLCKKARTYGIQLVLNHQSEVLCDTDAAGVHLNSRLLIEAKTRPLGKACWAGASCHNLEELLHAQNLGLDYTFLSPVLPTQTHPEAAALGWELFARWVDQVNIPVYALGGLSPDDLGLARRHGAQGVAGIRAFR